MQYNPEFKVSRIQNIIQDVVVNWEYLEEIGEPMRNVNDLLVAYTTAQAIHKLYKHLEALRDQVIYYDTDSVLYVYRGGLDRVPTGNYLREVIDELAEYGTGSYIVEFVSGGNKTYAYLVW